MNKKTFTPPFVVPTAAELNDGSGIGSNVGGGGGSLDSLKPFPMSFGEWAQSRWCSDYDNNPGVDFDDYANWWSQSGFGETAWAQFNPGSDLVDR
jgi:hypothetical protein